MVEFGEGNSQGKRLLGGEENSAGFGFCCRADHILEGIAKDVERCIWFLGGGWIITEDVPSGSSRAGFGEHKVG